MSLQSDLIQQARELALLDPTRPKQVSLRRSVSAAYYALFHLLTDEASRLLVSGMQREPLRLCLRRAFAHADMKAVAVGFASGTISEKIRPGLNGEPLQPELRDVAGAFVELQQARHEADYDIAGRFTRAVVLDLVEQATQAFDNWNVVRGTIQADTFLTALLVQRSLKG